jgi:tRNA A-37 threonylcarbamoyl transferase component Bud32
MKQVVAVFFILIIFFPASVKAGESTIRVDSDRKGEAQVLMRLYNTGGYKIMAHEIPATIKVDSNKTYDVMVVFEENFFFHYQGEKREIGAGETPTITTVGGVVWERVVAVALLPVLGVLEYNRRKKIRKARELEEDLRKTTEAAEDARVRTERLTVAGAIPGRIGTYQIVRKLGEGGMASVYKALDASEDVYALKVPDGKVFQDKEFIRRFIHEAKISKTLHHKHIVRTYDYNLDPEAGVPFICMEFIEGMSLSVLLENNSSLPLSRAIKYAREIAEALDYAHQNKVIHRDIKPGNLMITEKGSIKVMDFGIAKARDLSAVTKADTVLGTPIYMAPEQVDSKEVDHRADLYALGVILFEMTTGKLPFDDEDPFKVMMKKLSQKPPRPSTLNDLIPPLLDEIILKLLQKDPGARYQQASELLEDLKRVEET